MNTCGYILRLGMIVDLKMEVTEKTGIVVEVREVQNTASK
jgi:hypothetical protein